MVIRGDVAVIGAGPAGISAAIAASRLGGRVILVEKNAFIGGNINLGLTIHNFYNFSGERCINGIAGELIDRLEKIGGAIGTVDVKDAHISKVTPINDDIFIIMCLQMLKEEGIKLFLETTFYDLIMNESRIKRIKLFNKWNRFDLEAEAFIDCTGDADLYATIGLPFEKGRPKDGLIQPMGQMFRLGNVNIEKFLNKAGVAIAKGVKPGETQKSVVWFSASLSPWNDIITEQKLFFIGRDRLFWGNSIMKDTYNINITRIPGLDATKLEDKWKAEFIGKEQVYLTYQFFKDHVDGFENSFISKLPPFIGVRETRRIVGAYQLTENDFLEGRIFDDTIALSGYPIDIHNPEGGSDTKFIQVKNHHSFGIPYRCLYNEQCGNLLVAGRPISTTHEVHGATRVIATCMATGQAAGIAGYIIASRHIGARDLDIKELQFKLKKQKAILSM